MPAIRRVHTIQSYKLSSNQLGNVLWANGQYYFCFYEIPIHCIAHLGSSFYQSHIIHK